mmetsp:Transcript_28618/g.67787  ORF Transcript_28618/g.67787 Transcript_28618/m.67787 type:complete len:361 (-) Transcript_28618:252-1334(-)
MTESFPSAIASHGSTSVRACTMNWNPSLAQSCTFVFWNRTKCFPSFPVAAAAIRLTATADDLRLSSDTDARLIPGFDSTSAEPNPLEIPRDTSSGWFAMWSTVSEPFERGTRWKGAACWSWSWSAPNFRFAPFFAAIAADIAFERLLSSLYHSPLLCSASSLSISSSSITPDHSSTCAPSRSNTAGTESRRSWRAECTRFSSIERCSTLRRWRTSSMVLLLMLTLTRSGMTITGPNWELSMRGAPMTSRFESGGIRTSSSFGYWLNQFRFAPRSICPTLISKMVGRPESVPLYCIATSLTVVVLIKPRSTPPRHPYSSDFQNASGNISPPSPRYTRFAFGSVHTFDSLMTPETMQWMVVT